MKGVMAKRLSAGRNMCVRGVRGGRNTCVQGQKNVLETLLVGGLVLGFGPSALSGNIDLIGAAAMSGNIDLIGAAAASSHTKDCGVLAKLAVGDQCQSDWGDLRDALRPTQRSVGCARYLRLKPGAT